MMTRTPIRRDSLNNNRTDRTMLTGCLYLKQDLAKYGFVRVWHEIHGGYAGWTFSLYPNRSTPVLHENQIHITVPNLQELRGTMRGILRVLQATTM
jgi:hypothetical protein